MGALDETKKRKIQPKQFLQKNQEGQKQYKNIPKLLFFQRNPTSPFLLYNFVCVSSFFSFFSRPLLFLNCICVRVSVCVFLSVSGNTLFLPRHAHIYFLFL